MSDDEVVKGANSNGGCAEPGAAQESILRFVADKGKGSHGRLYFDGGSTTLKDRKKEIGGDLFSKMCRDLESIPANCRRHASCPH